MGLHNNGYATVWNVEEGKGNYLTAEISTRRKKPDGEYETDFSYKFVRLIGKAKDKGGNIPAKTRIKINECDVQYKSVKNQNGEWVNYFTPMIFDFDVVESKAAATESSDDDGFMKLPETDEEFLPFN